MNRPFPHTALDAPIQSFLVHQRTLGRDYWNEEYVLRGVRTFVFQHAATALDLSIFERWCEQLKPLAANTRRARQLIVRKLCLYRHRTEPECFVPDPLYSAAVPSAGTGGSRPYSRMLAMADTLASSANSPLRGPVLRLAIVLLYTAGLRRGEVLRLTLDDIDDKVGIVRVRESKFHKSRLVPLAISARQELRRYLGSRDAADADTRRIAPLLCNRSRGWRADTGTGLSDGVRRLIEQAGVCDAQGRRPCVHDLRHSFAVQALVRSYERGDDVQSGLPQLALYMGHVSIVSTAYYLHFVPTLAALASERFAQHFGHVLVGGGR